MKVLWVADFGLKHNIGGAQRTDSFVIQEGLDREHKIVFFNHDSSSELLNEEYDIVVSGNLESLSRREDVFKYLLNHPYHVRYEHDSNAYLSIPDRQKLFGSTKHSFFLSEFHHETFVKLYGDIFSNVNIITSPIDISKFYDYGDTREDKTLYIGFMHFLKGTQTFFRYVLENPDKQFVMACWGSPSMETTAKTFHNIKWLGKFPYESVPSLLNKYTTLYYHPFKFEPFCRSVGEAILCGMKTDCSDNIGAIHTLNKVGIEGLKERCTQSPKKFWDMVEGK